MLLSISRHGMAWPTLYMPCMEALEALGLLSFSLELGGEAGPAQVTPELYPFLNLQGSIDMKHLNSGVVN
jgi:hypothetical protein